MAEVSGQITGLLQEPGAVLQVLETGELGPQPAAHGVILMRERLIEGADTSDPGSGVAYHAEVVVGGGNVSGSFRCDWSGQFAVVCQRLTIRAVAVATHVEDLGYYGISDRRWRHAAIVGFGGWHAMAPLTLTLQEFALAGGITRHTVEVPRFGRRYRPRFGVPTGPLTGEFACAPADAADLDRVTISVASALGYSLFYTSSHRVTPELLRDGIDVSGAGYVSVDAPFPGSQLILTPCFELGL
jgi:hypothetical protein